MYTGRRLSLYTANSRHAILDGVRACGHGDNAFGDVCLGAENDDDDVHVGDGYGGEPKTIFEAALERERLEPVQHQNELRRLDMHLRQRLNKMSTRFCRTCLAA